MKTRDVMKTAEQGKKLLGDSKYLMTMPEFTQLYELSYKEEIWDAIITAFYFGAEVGARKAKSDQKKKQEVIKK